VAKKRSRMRVVIEVLLLLLASGVAYAWGQAQGRNELEPTLALARDSIGLLGAASAQDSLLLEDFRVRFGRFTDSLFISRARVEGLEDDLQRCLSLPSDTVELTVYDTVPGPERVVYDSVPVPGPVVYDTTYLPGEITIREVQTGRGYPHWSDFLQVGVAVAACLIIENTGGSETVTFRDNGEI